MWTALCFESRGPSSCPEGGGYGFHKLPGQGSRHVEPDPFGTADAPRSQQLHSTIRKGMEERDPGTPETAAAAGRNNIPLGFKNHYGIFQQRSRCSSDTRNRPWGRPRNLGRDQPSGRVWQRQSGREVPGHEAAYGRRRRCSDRHHSCSASCRTVWIITEGNR